MTAIVLGHVPIAITILPFVPIPSEESWSYIAVGILLHFVYQLLLLSSYRIGDLTQVYPIARGTAPLIVAGVSTGLLGVELKLFEIIAILVIGIGILSLSITRQKDGLRNVKAGIYAFLTGCFIAGYSLVDGIGARLAGTALSFYCWLTIGNAVVFAIFMLITKPGVLKTLPSQGKQVFLIGGSASFIAYAIVIWAFTQAPIALVTALRETSIVFALMIGVFFLKEKLDLAKLFSTMVTLLGAAILRLGKT